MDKPKNRSGRPTSYKGKMVQEYLKKFPNATTIAIARMLVKDNPLDFDDVEAVRGSVRYYRDELDKLEKAKTTVGVRTPQMRKEALSKFALPKTDYRKLKIFTIPKSSNRGLILSDIHIPYQDNDALRLVLEFALEYRPNFIYLNGDLMDMYQLSDFVKDRRLRDLAGEIEATRQFLALLKELFDCPVYYKYGNHEERYERYLRAKAPELLGIDEFELKALLRFAEYNVHEIKSKQKAFLGKLPIFHGHEFGKSVFSPVNPARGLFMRTKHTGAVGHHHIVSSHSEKTSQDKYLMTWSFGCLCGLSPEYMPNNNWMHGFATIEIGPTGLFHLTNHHIIDGVIY